MSQQVRQPVCPHCGSRKCKQPWDNFFIVEDGVGRYVPGMPIVDDQLWQCVECGQQYNFQVFVEVEDPLPIAAGLPFKPMGRAIPDTVSVPGATIFHYPNHAGMTAAIMPGSKGGREIEEIRKQVQIYFFKRDTMR